MVKEIQELFELKEKGILTEEEFTLAKQKLLEILKEEEKAKAEEKKLLLG